MSTKKQLITLEVIWWIFTFIILVAVLFPIQRAYIDFPFMTANIIYIIVFITYTRFLFLMKHTLFSKSALIKGVLVFFTIPLLFTLISNLSAFQFFLDEKGQFELAAPALLKNPMSDAGREWLSGYVRTEYFLFAVGSIFAAILMPFRLIVSIWRVRNRGTV